MVVVVRRSVEEAKTSSATRDDGTNNHSDASPTTSTRVLLLVLLLLLLVLNLVRDATAAAAATEHAPCRPKNRKCREHVAIKLVVVPKPPILSIRGRGRQKRKVDRPATTVFLLLCPQKTSRAVARPCPAREGRLGRKPQQKEEEEDRAIRTATSAIQKQ